MGDVTNRYAIRLSYLGTAYHGWQIQPNGNSVQAEVNKALSILLSEKIETLGAGRTDAGVHASYFVAHFDCTKDITNTNDLIYRLNRILPHDIAVQNIVSVSNTFHSRFHAIKRSYLYYISQEKNVFGTQTQFRFENELDIEKMNEASNMLLEFTDFTSFAKLHSDNKTNFCKICHAQWTKNGNLLIFKISADRFLRNMVRAIVGTLIQVGLGKITTDQFQNVIQMKNRKFAGWSAPAHGLFLSEIIYPENSF